MSYTLEMHEQFDCRRAPVDVFDYIVDFSRITEWDHTIVSAEKVSEGVIALGSRFDLLFAMGPRQIPIEYEITAFERPGRAVLTGTSDSFVAVDTVTITETKLGCHVDWHAELKFQGIAAKTVPLLQKKIKADGARTIRDLAKALQDDLDPPSLGTLDTLADRLILPGVLSFSKFGYQRASKHWKPVTASVRGKHIVITGATSGLGLATAHSLAHRGARLTLVARDETKAEQVKADLERQTGNTDITIEIAELSEMSQVGELAERLLARGDVIDVLINNAGALLNPRQETDEGFEKSFALLLLGPYLLTEKLHPLLASGSSSLHGGARVINVSSGGMYAKRISLSNLQSEKGKYSGADAYARAKRGLVIAGEEWAKLWTKDGITVHNMHPGWAFTPGVVTGLPQFTRITRRILRDARQGADTIIWLATATEVAETSGLFWLDRLPHSTHLTSGTRETRDQRIALMQQLEELASPWR